MSISSGELGLTEPEAVCPDELGRELCRAAPLELHGERREVLPVTGCTTLDDHGQSSSPASSKVRCETHSEKLNQFWESVFTLSNRAIICSLTSIGKRRAVAESFGIERRTGVAACARRTPCSGRRCWAPARRARCRPAADTGAGRSRGGARSWCTGKPGRSSRRRCRSTPMLDCGMKDVGVHLRVLG